MNVCKYVQICHVCTVPDSHEPVVPYLHQTLQLLLLRVPKGNTTVYLQYV